MKKTDFESYDFCVCNALCDLLLFTSNIDTELKKYQEFILNPTFTYIFEQLIELISEKEVIYPEVARYNALKILDFIKENSYFNNIEKCYQNINEMTEFSDDRYNFEYIIKHNSLNDITNQKQEWSKQEFEESLKYDFYVINSLGLSKEEFINKHIINFLLDKKFIYSINRFLYTMPDIIKIPEVYNLVELTLRTNSSLINSLSKDFKKNYIIKNCKDNPEILDSDIKVFEEMNENTYMSLKNIDIACYSNYETRQYYSFLKVQNYLYAQNSIELDKIDINNIIDYIDLVDEIEDIARYKLIDALDSKKSEITKEELPIYNKYLIKLNSLQTAQNRYQKIVELENKIFPDEYIKILVELYIKNSSNLVDEICSVENDLSFFETITGFNEQEIPEGYPYIIRKFLLQCPSIFLNKKIHKKVLEILDNNNQKHSRKVKRKILKIKEV